MAEIAKLVVGIAADLSDLERDFKKAEGMVGGFGGVLQGAATVGFTALAAGAAGVVGGLGAATKSAADFQSQISGIAAVGGKEAVDRMSEISAKALQVGKDTSFSASEAAAGMEELIKAGVSINDVLGGATDATVALAAATGVDLAGAAEIAANAMNQFGLAGEQIGGIADIVAGAANASAIDVNDFKFSLASVGAVANTVGLSFQDTAVAIAEMGQAGIKGSDAGTSLKTMLLNLQPTTKAQVAEFQRLGLATIDYDGALQKLLTVAQGWTGGQAAVNKLQKEGTLNAQSLFEAMQKLNPAYKGIDFAKFATDSNLVTNSFFDQTGKIKPLVEIQGELNKALAGLTDQQRLASLEILFGSDAIRAGAVLAKQGAEGYTEMAGAMSQISAADVAKTRLDNLNGSMEALKGSLETAGITIGTALLPSLKLLVDVAIGVLNQNMPLIEQFSAQLPGAMAATGTFVTGTLMPALGNLAAALGPPLRATLDWLITTGWPTLVAAATAFSAWMNTTGIPALTSLTAALGPPLNAVVTWLMGTGFPGLLTAVTGVSTGVQGLTTFFGQNTAALSILSGVVTAGATAWGLMTAATLAHTIATKAQTIAAGLATAAQTALNFALTANPIGIVVVALAGLTAALVTAYNTNETFRNSVNNIGQSLGNFSTWLTTALNNAAGLADKLNSIGEALRRLPSQLPDWMTRNLLTGQSDMLQRTSFRPGGAGAIGGDAMSLTRGGGGSGLQGDALMGHIIDRFSAAYGAEAGRAAGAVALTEGGLYGAVGDSGQSFGPFQFYKGGQLPNFAAWLNTSLEEAANLASARPDLAVQFALENYLGSAIQAGLNAGLSGPALATYAQRYGQVSVSPERAGQSYNSLFGSGGSMPETTVDISGGSSGMRQYIPADKEASTSRAELAGSTDLITAADIRAAQAERDFGGLLTSNIGPTQALGAAQQFNGQWAQTMADQQARLAAVLQGQVDPATISTGTAMANLSAVLGPIERQVAGGAISMDTLQFTLVDLARATGLATAPWRDYDAGLIDVNEAMMRVVNQSADAGPQFEALRQQLGTTNAITDQGALSWLQLALNYGKATPALQANVAATTTATAATASLNSAVGTVNTTMDPGQYQQVTGAVNEMTGALGTAKGAFGEMGSAAAGAKELLAEFDSAAHSLADFLDGHTFHVKIEVDPVPSEFMPGSPTPFEMGLRGIADAEQHLGRISMRGLRSLEMPSAAALQQSVAERGSGGSSTTVNNITANVPNFIGTKDELIDALHDGLLRKKRRNSRLGLGDND